MTQAVTEFSLVEFSESFQASGRVTEAGELLSTGPAMFEGIG